MNQGLPRGLLLGAVLALAACDENPESNIKFGTIELTTSAPSAEKELVTSDAWTVKYEKLLVHVSAINVLGLDGVLTASATGQIVDQVLPPPKLLLSSGVRLARHWEDVSFQVGPAAEGTTALSGVQEPDAAMMTKGGFSIYLVARATKGADTKAFTWGFTSDTLYKDCQGELGGGVVRGMVVPPKGVDSADILMRGDVFFSDKLDGTGALRFDAIAAADTDADGVVTLEELTAVTLDVARAGGAPYDVGGKAEIIDLGAYVQNLTVGLVGSFRARGQCTAEPVSAEAL